MENENNKKEEKEKELDRNIEDCGKRIEKLELDMKEFKEALALK